MKITIDNKRIAGRLNALEYAPLLHRYLVCNALTEGHEPPRCMNHSTDILMTAKALKELGLEPDFRSEDPAPVVCCPETADASENMKTQSSHICRINCGGSENTYRFILPVAAALGKACELTMHKDLMSRPVADLLKTLKVHGIRHEFINTVSMRIWGRLTAGTFVLSSQASSWFISGLLFALPLLPENSVIMVDGRPDHIPEIRMTLDVLAKAGIRIDAEISGTVSETEGPAGYTGTQPQGKGRSWIGAVFRIPGGQKYQMPVLPETEGDWSVSAYYMTAAALSGGPLVIRGLHMGTAQKEKKILRILKDAGVTVEYGNEPTEFQKKGFFLPVGTRNIGGIDYSRDECDAEYIRITGPWADISEAGPPCSREHLKAIECDGSDIQEIIPAIVMLGCYAKGTTCIRNAVSIDHGGRSLRRLHELIRILETMGIMIWESAGSLYVEGYTVSTPLPGGCIDSCLDERLAMMSGVASCISSAPVTLERAEAVRRTDPEFFKNLRKLQVI